MNLRYKDADGKTNSVTAQRIGVGLASIIRGADRKFSAAGRFGANSGKAAAVFWPE